MTNTEKAPEKGGSSTPERILRKGGERYLSNQFWTGKTIDCQVGGDVDTWKEDVVLLDNVQH